MREDWKEFLSEDARRELQEILEMARRHRPAYSQADDVRIAQIWSALIELRKEIKEIREITEKVAAPFKAIVEVGEKEKRRAIERIVTEIIRPTTEQKESVQKLIDSLMKF